MTPTNHPPWFPLRKSPGKCPLTRSSPILRTSKKNTAIANPESSPPIQGKKYSTGAGPVFGQTSHSRKPRRGMRHAARPAKTTATRHATRKPRSPPSSPPASPSPRLGASAAPRPRAPASGHKNSTCTRWKVRQNWGGTSWHPQQKAGTKSLDKVP